MSSQAQTKSRSMTLIVGLAIVIAIVAYFAVKNPVPGDDAAGTIAPAERVRGEQISGDDVALDVTPSVHCHPTVFSSSSSSPSFSVVFSFPFFLLLVN